ncbi:hypothetical protein ALC56_13673 [Trachymyrmex septentrionalis]|uniref:Uncharacterized protein n=1 Tax=Trachymyrmex septentrionalis TaxID=34720 RepID=A0A195EUI9_9HYME|nr:hypothetical protein ALC56_13673 [Trachymyrmex septentrionalis]
MEPGEELMSPPHVMHIPLANHFFLFTPTLCQGLGTKRNISPTTRPRSTFPNSSRRQLPRNFSPPHARARARKHVSRTLDELFYFIHGNRFLRSVTFSRSPVGIPQQTPPQFSHAGINKIDNVSVRFGLLHKTFKLVLLIENKIQSILTYYIDISELIICTQFPSKHSEIQNLNLVDQTSVRARVENRIPAFPSNAMCPDPVKSQSTSPAFTNNRADTGRLEIRLPLPPQGGCPIESRGCYFMKVFLRSNSLLTTACFHEAGNPVVVSIELCFTDHANGRKSGILTEALRSVVSAWRTARNVG